MSKAYAKAYAKKKKETVPKKAQSPSVSQKTNDPKEARRQESARNVRKAVTKFVSEDRRTAGQNQKMNMPTAEQQRRSQQTMKAAGKAIKSSVKESMSEESRARAQRVKSGIQTAEDQRKMKERNEHRVEVAKNTGRAAVKGAKDTVSGYGQALADIDEMVKSNKNWTAAKAQKMGIDEDDIVSRAKIEGERQQSIKEAREFRRDLARKQEKRQKEFDEQTKDATELEKALYGAAESGTGMLIDTGIGAVTGTGQFGALASMGLRTYGTTRGQAEKEGATENEDRLYSLAQAGKEVGTELMFPGAGLARKAYGKVGLDVADKAALTLTKGLTGKKADVVSAGVRLIGGTAEENAEELAGWGLDPLLKEAIYGKNVRQRMADRLKSNLPEITNQADADRVASYFSTSQFTDDLKNEYVSSGMSQEDASKLADQMRDYYVAYYSGDEKTFNELEDKLTRELTGTGLRGSWSMDELKDTLASTTLLTMATGLPGAATTSMRGNAIFDSDEVKEVFGDNAVNVVADAVKNVSDPKLSLKAEAYKQRLDEGKDLTGTQKYELYQGYLEKVKATAEKKQASESVIVNESRKNNYVPTVVGVMPDGQQVYAKETQMAYNEKYASTSLTTEAFSKYMESDGSISQDEADRKDAVNKAVSDLHVGGLTVGDTHEFAYGNTLAREVLKEEEGIDLNDYVVRDSKGNVDLAATNEATENALFELNAKNALAMAKTETEVYIDDTRGSIDADLLTRFGNSGQAVWKSINKDLDPRDLNTYLTHANADSYFYAAGRNTDMSVDEAVEKYGDTFKSVSNAELERAFAAGQRDRIIANTPGYGQTVKSGSNIKLKKTEPILSGQLIMDDDVKAMIPDSVQSEYLALAEATGANIHLVSDLSPVDKDGNPIVNKRTGKAVQLNGMSKGNDIWLNVNTAAEKNLGYVFMHEMTHQIKQYAPNEYMALENLVRDKWFNKDYAQMQRMIKERIDLYKTKGGQSLTEEEALEEIIADAMAEAIDDPNFAAEVCETNEAVGQQILNAIKSALRSIRDMFARDEYKNKDFHNALLSYLGILDDAEKMWLEALAVAKQNKANGLIADWQDRANRQSRYSITTDKEDFIKGANLSKDLRDWAKEMGLDKLSKQPVKGPVIVSVRDLRTAWYEKNGRADEANVINTALDKIGDSLTQLVGKYQYIDLGDALNAAVTYRTDAEGHPTSVILSCQVKNAEYEVNFDFTTICAKRLAMQKILERFIKTEGERQGTTLYDELKLDEEGLYKLRLILETAGFDVSCRGCFVEQNRYSQQNQARTIANDWNAALDEWAKDNGTEVTETFGLTTLDIDNLDYEEIEAGFERYHELMKGKKTDVATKNRMLIEASPFFRKRMNASDYASMAGQRALMAIGESKKGGTNLYGLLKRGQSDSKQSVPFTAYNGEIALLPDNMKGKSLYDYLLSIGGARAQSASDFQIEFVYDYMQMVADLSARGLPMHMYTKVIELAELFGMTGIKINLSAMCDVAEDVDGEYAGLKLVDGKYEYNISDQSIDYEKAVKLQKKEGYSKNIGIIMVTLSSQHMLKSLDDPDVRYIIGYHSSAMPVVVSNMSNMGGATDYTKINKTNKLNEKGQALFNEAMEEAKGNTELERYKDALRIFDRKIQEETAKKKKKPRRGNEYGAYMSAYGNNTADFNTYDSLLETKDARKTADKYLEHCMEHDLIPIYFPFAFHDNYYKCEIYDFNMYDNNTGEYAPMESVQNIYPGLNMAEGETDTTAFTKRVSQMMDAQNRVNKSLDSQYDAVFDEAKKELKYSITGDDYMDIDASGIDHSELVHRADAPKTEAQIRDDDYMDAVNSGDMDKAQSLVDEAALQMPNVAKVTRGRMTKPLKLYHGTRYFGFTQFRDDLHDVPFIYTSTDRTVSAHYAGDQHYASPRPIGKPYREGDSIDDLIENAKTVWQTNYHVMTPDEKKARYNEVIDEAKKIADKIDELDVPFDSFADGDDYSFANAVDNVKYLFWVARDMDDDFYYNYDEDNGYREESVQYHQDAVDGFERNIERVREYYHENHNNLTDEQKKLLSYLIGYEVGDAAIDMRYVLKVMTEEDRLMNEYGYGRVPSEMKETLDSIHNIAAYELYGDLGEKPFEFDANGAQFYGVKVPEMGDGYYSTDAICKWAYENGYTSVIMHNIYDYGDKADNYVFFNSAQLKSADTVTYAEDGSVIPLSERFDPNNDDIRYSMPTQDSEGRVLSDGQMEYFANSQARDEQGRLVPVYHTTNKGGFTIFDPMKSDDHRSLFFADDWDTSQTYGNYANSRFYYFDIDNIDDVKKYLDAYSPDRYFVTQEQFDQAGGWEADMLDFENVTNGEQSDFAKYLDNPDGYIAIIGVPDYSPDNTSYADTWVMAKSPDELVRELHNHFGWQRDNYRMGTQHGYYACYLNLEDPYIIDAHGDNWNEIHLDDYDDDVTFNTREIAEMAMDMDFDGVIIRNLVDHGGKSPYDGMFDYSDIYIAFSSNQVKDINNENPTENPDIRYSIPDRQEALDTMIVGADSIERIPLRDTKLEEQRVKYSLSVKDFENMIISGWDEHYRTFGRLLDDESVKPHLISMMSQIMKDSETGRQYKAETLDETIKDMKVMYFEMKKGMSKEFADRAWAAAERIVDDIDYNDDLYVEYKGMRDYLNKRWIQIPEALMYDEDFAEYMRDNSGRMRFRENGSGVEAVYKYLRKKYPKIFTEDLDDPVDMLLQMDYVLDLTSPYRDAYTSEEYTDLVKNVAESLCEMVRQGEEYRSVADDLYEKFDARSKAMKQRHNEVKQKIRDQYGEKIASLRQEKKEAVENVRQEEKEKRQRQSDRANKWKEKYKQRIQHDKEVRETKKEKKMHRALYDAVLNEYNDLTKRLLKPSKDKAKNIPEQLRQPLAEMLYVFDLEKERSKELEEMYRIPTRTQLNLRQMKDSLEKVIKEDETAYEFSDIHRFLKDKMTEIADKMDMLGDHSIDALDNNDIAVIKDLMVGLNSAIKNYQQFEIDGEKYEAQQVCDKVGEGAKEHESIYGKGKKYTGARAFVDNIVNMGELTPIYFFKQIKGMYDMYRQIRKGFDSYVRNEKVIIDKIADILAPYYKTNRKGQRVQGSQIEEWRHLESAETFNTTYGTLTLTIAQRMSLYCLYKRDQARNHMLSDRGGVVASEITAGSKMHKAEEMLKGKVVEYKQTPLTPEDVENIIATLTPEQIQIANDLQNLMSNDMSKLGNQASVKLTGIEMYKETEYFPIKIQAESKGKDLDNIGMQEKVRNPGFSNPLQDHASNPIILDDIFSVVANHCNEMNLYASYAVPLTNFMKVYNGSVLDENGDAVKVQTVIKQTYGEKAIQYIDNFLDDINGNSFKRHGGLDDVLDKTLGQAKKASVFANLRVALQQPTAIVRAFAVMNPKYFKGVLPSKMAVQEMIEHCPIAQWKAWGYYDTHFGRDIEDVMMGANVSSKADYLMSEIYGEFDKMTWGMIWQAVKKEVKAENPKVTEGSQEFWDLCSERASYVFDTTQVVDSPFHRSNDMRSKNGLVKQLTSFQSEPTLSFNVLRQGFVDAYEEYKKGNKAKAEKALAKVLAVWTAQAATVAIAQSFVDALRRKGADDDEDPNFFALWWQNFIADFVDDLNPINNVYYFKEIVPPILNALTGQYVFGQQNLTFQWVDTLTKGIQKCKKKWEKGSAYSTSWYDCLTDLFGGVGYLAGIPVKTMMRGLKNAVHWFNKVFGTNVFADDGSVDKAVDSMVDRFRKEKGDTKSSDEEDAEEGLSKKDAKKIFKAGIKAGEKAIPKTEEQMLKEIEEKTVGLYGEDRERKIWNIVGEGYKEYVNKGDYDYLNRLRNVIQKAGGDVNAFDKKVLDASRSAFKKSLVSDPTDAQIMQQQNIRSYLLEHGMSEEEISSELIYKSQTARDLKAAFRMGNENYIVDELVTLLRAGVTRDDIYKLYKYRNYGAKDYDGKYASPEYTKTTGQFIWPTDGVITSHFGYRDSPTAGASSNHPAIDIGASQGTPVVAADGGVVISAGANGGYGNSVGIKHSNGMVTWYNHLYGWNVKVGDEVGQGQQIGQVGSTGISTGPHLDFKIMDADGNPVDPEQYLNKRS